MTKDEYKAAIKAAKDKAMPTPPAFPHSCAGCFHLKSEGFCSEVQDYPPLEFIEQENECGSWEPDIPF